ncbi:MAG TPA: helix-turn-helix transcriptional regulator [Syntrophomonadaceae bacterium]|nr:helix-turn-helix transcriptional regulator [Syntrophomonadaceae bacterium]HPR92439.1 helix-turn-helix transcriptional regulator [Syntrophomonadaceae bacterium]
MSFKYIGLKIQLAREEKGLSQDQLAKALGCSQSALSNYEKGKRRLYLSQLEALAEILDKPLDYFVESMQAKRFAVDIDENDNSKQKIRDAIERLNEQQLDKVLEYINYLQWTKEGSK